MAAYACQAGAEITNAEPGRKPAHQCARAEDLPCTRRQRALMVRNVVPIVPELTVNVSPALRIDASLDAESMAAALALPSQHVLLAKRRKPREVGQRPEARHVEAGRGETIAIEGQLRDRDLEHATHARRPPAAQRRRGEQVQSVEWLGDAPGQLHASLRAAGSLRHPGATISAAPSRYRTAGHSAAKRVVTAT